MFQLVSFIMEIIRKSITRNGQRNARNWTRVTRLQKQFGFQQETDFGRFPFAYLLLVAVVAVVAVSGLSTRSHPLYFRCNSTNVQVPIQVPASSTFVLKRGSFPAGTGRIANARVFVFRLDRWARVSYLVWRILLSRTMSYIYINYIEQWAHTLASFAYCTFWPNNNNGVYIFVECDLRWVSIQCFKLSYVPFRIFVRCLQLEYLSTYTRMSVFLSQKYYLLI